MYKHDATEEAYKNGYENGYAAALAIGELKMATKKRLIEVETVIEKIRKANCADCYSCDGVLCRACLVDDFISLFDDSTVVNAVEVVHGRWIHDCVEGCNPFVDSLPIWVDVMQCSVCKEYIEGSHGTNYCPNCGAKMDLEDKE